MGAAKAAFGEVLILGEDGSMILKRVLPDLGILGIPQSNFPDGDGVVACLSEGDGQ